MDQALKKWPVLIVLLLTFAWSQAQEEQGKISPQLLRATADGNEAECLIVFRSAADLSDLRSVHGKEKKGALVFQRLRSVADHGQHRVQRMLQEDGRTFQSFYIVNSIYTKVDRDFLLRLARQPEVKRIQANPWVRVLDWRQSPGPVASGRGTIEWGVNLINAPALWAQGINGSGVVIGGQDTGVEWTHPALKEKYRAWQGDEEQIDHNYHWFDAITALSPLHEDEDQAPTNNPCGLSVDIPCDDNNHGTYVTGISLGDDGQGNQVGVAPGARWIACRNMERGYGSPATYLAGFEWFLAPTDLNGNNPRPDLAPHVINNSWGCPEIEGCTPENWGILETAIDHLRAAGVVVVVSAGNAGPACNSVDDPSAIFANAFAVGATDIADTLAGFSSRGPVTIDGSGRLKPNVVAPGVDIRSSVRNGQFSSASGTSAAGPMVVGAVALIIQANPELAGEVALIEQILQETTVPAFDVVSCGGYTTADVPNPMTGYGRIDALAAVQRARQVSPVRETDRETHIRVYPNPGRGAFHFISSASEGVYGSVLEVYDAMGRRLESSVVSTLPVEVDLSGQPAGVYWWKWCLNGQIATGAFVKR